MLASGRRRCRFLATARPQAGGLLQAKLIRSAQMPQSDQRWLERRFPRGQRVLDGRAGVRLWGRISWLAAIWKAWLKSGSRSNTAMFP